MVEANSFTPGGDHLENQATDGVAKKPDVFAPEDTDYSIPDFDEDPRIIVDEALHSEEVPENIPDLGKGPVIMDENPYSKEAPESPTDLGKKDDPYGIPTFAQAVQEGANDKPHKDGPEDKEFDENNDSDLEEAGYENYSEDEFTKGDAGVPGRKPTPDGVSVKDDTKIYWEDKRPSETEHNSWLSTYENDPIAEQRTETREKMESGKLSMDEAEAKVVIAEHDDHYEKKGERWNDPAELQDDGRQEKLGIRIPDNEANQGRITAIEKELADTGRNPQVSRENGNCRIVYDIPSNG